MTTLAANAPRAYEQGERNHLPVIAADIIYEGAAVGRVAASGHARPLTAVDDFAGFAVQKADNAAGAAAAINVEVQESGTVQLAVTGALITDVGLPVYATDDNTFALTPVGGVFVGFLKRFVSAGVGIVAFDVRRLKDPWYGWLAELKSVNYTIDIQDNGKLICVDTDAVVITLPVTATGGKYAVMNIAGFGVAKVSIDPAAADKVQGPDIAGTDNKDLINTKATARRGDFCEFVLGQADGAYVTRLRGTWATEA